VTVQRFCAPGSLAEAVAMLAAGENAAVLAGGTDLLVQMRARTRAPDCIVDLKRIPGMSGIVVDAHGALIGAATPGHEITASAELAATWPGLVEAVALIGSTQVQGRASIGGNLCNASPAADSVPALVANRASVLIQGPDGERRAAVESLLLGPGRTALASGEFVHAIVLPLPAPRSADAYLRFTPRSEMDIAVAGAGVALTLDGDGVCVAARIALGAVAPTVLLASDAAEALIGSRLDAPALQRCVDAARACARPISDRRGTADFRRHVCGVLVRRAVIAAAARAGVKV
jgi:CO/xanthine dehydrogenase FAD-binding subunit